MHMDVRVADGLRNTAILIDDSIVYGKFISFMLLDFSALMGNSDSRTTDSQKQTGNRVGENKGADHGTS